MYFSLKLLLLANGEKGQFLPEGIIYQKTAWNDDFYSPLFVDR